MRNLEFFLLRTLAPIIVSVVSLFGLSGNANAALITCGPIQIEDSAECQISGTYATNSLPANFSSGPTSITIDGGGGNTDLTVYNGVAVGAAVCGNPFQTSGMFGDDCNFSFVPATTYLLYVFETGGGTERQYVVGTATGAEILSGVDYLEGTLTGTAKYNIYGLPNSVPVPVPATIALLGIGLFAMRRKFT